MNRAILSPAAFPAAALAELKAWLAITTAADDAALSTLVAAALDLFEAFTGIMPLVAQCEELLPARAGECAQALATRPVRAVSLVEAIAADGTRQALPSAAYALEPQADGAMRIRLSDPGPASRIAVRFTAGMAEEWGALPAPLRHGVIRLAAHQFRRRDDGEGQGEGAQPPAAIAGLWQPWRRIRLA